MDEIVSIARVERSRFDWVRVPQVRVCDACRSAAAEKANAREALICQQPTERPQMPRPAREREKVFRFENDSREPQPNLLAHLRNELPL